MDNSAILRIVSYFIHNQVAEMEMRSLKESIEYEKKKYLVLETEFNEFKACCTCSEGGKVKTTVFEYCADTGLFDFLFAVP